MGRQKKTFRQLPVPHGYRPVLKEASFLLLVLKNHLRRPAVFPCSWLESRDNLDCLMRPVSQWALSFPFSGEWDRASLIS